MFSCAVGNRCFYKYKIHTARSIDIEKLIRKNLKFRKPFKNFLECSYIQNVVQTRKIFNSSATKFHHCRITRDKYLFVQL